MLLCQQSGSTSKGGSFRDGPRIGHAISIAETPLRRLGLACLKASMWRNLGLSLTWAPINEGAARSNGRRVSGH